MKYKLRILFRAERDVRQIFAWLAERSPGGARRWYLAFEAAALKLVRYPTRYGLAPESEGLDYELRQFLFKTRRGRTYRGVFTVVDDQIRLLRVRGPGQPHLESDELRE